MKTTYWIWNNLSHGGTATDWREITGQEFLTLVRSPEAQGRYFVKLDSVHEDGGDGILVMEATETEYHKWRKEKRRKQYLRDTAPDYTVVSYEAPDVLEDTETDIETECLKLLELGLLREALTRLTVDEYRLITFLFLSENQRTDQHYSDVTGIPRRTITYRKKTTLKKLKSFFEG